MGDTRGSGKHGKQAVNRETHQMYPPSPLPPSLSLPRALKANTTHPDLDTITRCHNYDISYKYSYKCTRCDYKYVTSLSTEISHSQISPPLNAGLEDTPSQLI